MCSGYECSVQWQVWDREVWQRVLGWFSGNDLVVHDKGTHTTVASDLDGVQWPLWNGEGSTVVVHHADSTHWYTLEQTESGQITPAITQHTVLTK